MNKNIGIVRTICEIAIFAALGFVFDELQGILLKGVFVGGGSIGFAMIAVVIVTFRRGAIPGILTGLIMGLLDLSTGPYILSFWQVLLDYVFPYCFVALSAIVVPLFRNAETKKNKIWLLGLGVCIGGFAKFLSHYFSGLLFFTDQSGFAFNLNNTEPWLYSLIYNIAYMGPCIVLTAALAAAIEYRAPSLFEYQNKENEIIADRRIKVLDYVLNPAALGVGIFGFVYYLLKYIDSYEGYTDSYNGNVVYGAEFNPDYLVLYVTGASLILFTVLHIIKTILKKPNYRLMIIACGSLALDNAIYGLARAIKYYNVKYAKKLTIEEHNALLEPYWRWFFVGVIVAVLFAIIYVLIREKIKNEQEK